MKKLIDKLIDIITKSVTPVFRYSLPKEYLQLVSLSAATGQQTGSINANFNPKKRQLLAQCDANTQSALLLLLVCTHAQNH